MRSAALVTHGLSSGAPTGVGRYAREVISSVAALGPERSWSVSAGTSPENGDPGLPPDVAVHRLPGPRKLLHLALTAGLPVPVIRSLGDPDLIHQLNPWVPLPARCARVLTVHDLIPITDPQWFPAGHRWRFSATVRRAAAEGVTLVFDSSHVADLSRELLGATEVHVVHAGVQDTFRTPADPAAVASVCDRLGVGVGAYLLALGVMSPREDPTVVLDAMTALSGDLPLVVTGPDRPGNQVRRSVTERGLGSRVVFAGFVPDGDLVPLIAGATALVHPSRDEGFGFTPLEAMAVGTPVIASAAGSLPEVTGGAAVLLDPGDSDAWAEAIDAVVTDDARRRELVDRGRMHQAAFTWKRTAGQLLDIYDGLVP